MSGEKVQLWVEGILGPGESAQWFEDYAPIEYNKMIRRVRTYQAIPYVYLDDPPDQPARPLSLPPDPPWPDYEQRIAVTQVFYLLKATPHATARRLPAERTRAAGQCRDHEPHARRAGGLPRLRGRDGQLADPQVIALNVAWNATITIGIAITDQLFRRGSSTVLR